LECDCNFNYQELSIILKNASIEHLRVWINETRKSTQQIEQISVVESIKSIQIEQSIPLDLLMDVIISLPSLESGNITFSESDTLDEPTLLKLVQGTHVDISAEDKKDWEKHVKLIFRPNHSERVSRYPLLVAIKQNDH
jgi:hypothetical protein